MSVNTSTNVIEKPVSISDVNGQLSTSVTDLGSLCTHANINAYSKYKPVSYPAVGWASDAAKETALKGVNYGYLIPISTDDGALSLSELCAYIVNGTKPDSTHSWYYKTGTNLVNMGYGWYYQMPVGGSASPYRLGDFVGYKSDVPKRMLNLYTLSAEVNINDSASWEDFTITISSESTSWQVNLWELTNYNDCFLGICAYNSSKSSIYYITTPYTMPSYSATSPATITLTKDNMKTLIQSTTGTWTLVPFLTTASSTTPTAAHDAIPKAIPLPSGAASLNVTNSSSGPVSVKVKWTIDADVAIHGNYITININSLTGHGTDGSVSMSGYSWYYVISVPNDGFDSGYVSIGSTYIKTTTISTSETTVISGITYTIRKADYQQQYASHNIGDELSFVVGIAYDNGTGKVGTDTSVQLVEWL